MLSVMPRKRRRSGEPKTFSVLATSRVFVPEHDTREDVDKDPNKKHQSRHGGVFKFVPQPDKKCCNRRCLRIFLENDPAVETARAPLYDRNMSVIERRER
jgi:hypothetical protein